MTGTDERAEGRRRAPDPDPTVIGRRPGPDPAVMGRRPDPDATVIMSGPFNANTEATILLPTVPVDRDAAPSVGYDVNPAETAAPDTSLDGSGTSVARQGATMALLSVVSRVTGFLRTAAIGAAIGVVAIGNAYTGANVLPGMVYELLLGGVLSSVVIPLIVRARARDRDRGEAYTQRLLTLAVVFLAGATVIAVLSAPLLTRLLTTDRTLPADVNLMTTLAYLLLPMIFFYGMSAMFAAVLNTRGHFAAPTFAPILNNLVVIGMAATLLAIHIDRPDDAASLTSGQIAILGLGTTLGIVVQAVGLWPALRRVDFRWRWRWDFRELRLRELGKISSWMLVYVGVSQIGVFVVLNLAQQAFDNDKNAAGTNIFNNAFLIFMMAHGIVAVSIITALMPRMAAAAEEGRHADLVHQMSLGARLTSVVLIPTTVGYLVLGRPLGVTLFNQGNYGHAQAVTTGWVIAVAGLGLVPFALSQLQLFAFYAMPDTKTPALINIPVVALRILVDIVLFVVLPASWVAGGLMAGNAISYVLAAIVGYALLRRRIGPLELRRVFTTMGKLFVAAIVAGVPTLLVVLWLDSVSGDSKLAGVIQLLVGGAILLAGYVGLSFVLRVPEMTELTNMIRSRLGR